MILINPDNPTGNYIKKASVLELLNWCKEKDITFILDESFVDFAEEEDSSFINEEYLNLYDKFIVVKSISKSYGVPGVRLGVLCTSNINLINHIKRMFQFGILIHLESFTSKFMKNIRKIMPLL